MALGRMRSIHPHKVSCGAAATCSTWIRRALPSTSLYPSARSLTLHLSILSRTAPTTFDRNCAKYLKHFATRGVCFPHDLSSLHFRSQRCRRVRRLLLHTKGVRRLLCLMGPVRLTVVGQHLPHRPCWPKSCSTPRLAAVHHTWPRQIHLCTLAMYVSALIGGTKCSMVWSGLAAPPASQTSGDPSSARATVQSVLFCGTCPARIRAPPPSL